VCGKSFSVEHAFSCPCGGFPSMRHNDICDLTASEVCCNVGVKPALQPLDHEPLRYATANREDVVLASTLWLGTSGGRIGSVRSLT